MTNNNNDIRVGIGYDVHKLTENRKLILGGVEIKYEKGLDGHSDADVLIHAVRDALLGAAALGEYKGADSIDLLKHVGELLKNHGYAVINIDSVIAAQEPKLAPFIELMRSNISSALNIDTDRVSVKATTTERLGFEGRCEGISAQAVCSIKKAQ